VQAGFLTLLSQNRRVYIWRQKIAEQGFARGRPSLKWRNFTEPGQLNEW